jgi:anti-sigma B factor antagonist
MARDVNPDRCQISIDQTEQNSTVMVAGVLDLIAHPVFERHLDSLHAADVGHITLDLSKVEFMDSTGLRGLLKARRQAEMAGRFLTLNSSPAVDRVLRLVGLSDRFNRTPEDRVDEARDGLPS